MDEMTTSSLQPVKNRRSAMLKWAGGLNIATAIAYFFIGILVMFFKIETTYENYRNLYYTGAPDDLSFEEWQQVIETFQSGINIILGFILIALAGLFIFFAIKQLKYAKIYDDIEFSQTKNLLIGILSLILSNWISGLLGILAHNTKNNLTLQSGFYTQPAQSNSANEMEAKIMRLKEMYAKGQITLEEYNELMNKIDF